MWLPDEALPSDEDCIIEADTWWEALIKRFDDTPEYVFNDKVWKVIDESIEWDMRVEYTISYDCWNLYVDRYISNDDKYDILKLFYSRDELIQWLKEEGH